MKNNTKARLFICGIFIMILLLAPPGASLLQAGNPLQKHAGEPEELLHSPVTGKTGPSEQQQDKTAHGRVADMQGHPLPGVTVMVKGTSNGTVTDVNGDYTIGNVPADGVLVFSFVGMKKQEIPFKGQTSLTVVMQEDILGIEEVVAIGYGSMKKSDLTGSVHRVNAEAFKTQSLTQFTEMLTGTIAGFNADQETSAQGGSSMEIRGPTSLTAGTTPLIVIDGVIFTGSVRDINTYDIESIDILKDASSSAVFGAKAASGVVIITTTRGSLGKPTINFSSKIGLAESYYERRGLGPKEYIQFRQDYLRQIHPEVEYDYYSDPGYLRDLSSVEEWRELSQATLGDNTREWLRRLGFYDIEVENYLAGKTTDWYDEVFRTGLRQEYDVSISGGTEAVKYYWSLGYNNNEGVRLGDQYSSFHSKLNLDFKVNDWLNVGLNTQFSDRDEASVPADMGFYVNSPFGQMFDEEGNLERYPHGHSDNPLLDYYRTSLLSRKDGLFAILYASLKLPLGFNFKVSFQPRYEASKYYKFTTISKELGGLDSETSSGQRQESSTRNWMVDHLLTWNRKIGAHHFDVTLLANFEENQYWYSYQYNKNFSPNQELGYHGLQYGDSPGISDNDTRSTGNAYMARVNYTLKDKYLLTASVRRDGYSAFGKNNKTAVFPAFALGWVLSEEEFFNTDLINRMKIRLSWGINGNRDIGIYSALATTSSDLWYNGSNTVVGVHTSSLANNNLKWEKTSAFNLGLDIALLKERIELNADVYEMTTKDLLMKRSLPDVTGFSSIMANLGELRNRGVEVNLNTVNMNTSGFGWKTNLVFSLNRNKIIELFGDYSTYTLMGKQRTGDVPDFTNGWFPGEAIDVVWDYNITGIWQSDEADEAAAYGLEPGDYKAKEVIEDGSYVDTDDKQFIGHTEPRYRLGLRNDFTFLKNFTASVFIRADLGHIGSYSVALNNGYESNDRWNRNNGPVPYWTVDRPHDEYPRLNPTLSSFGGGLMIYKRRSFVRIQDVSLAYALPADLARRMKMDRVQIFGSVRNLATFTDWPGWDPESGMSAMPRTYTLGVNFSL
jgi:TonB-linked SusC/RagA family outer membrane protein